MKTKFKTKKLCLSNGLIFIASQDGCEIRKEHLSEKMDVKRFLNVIQLMIEMQKTKYLKPSFCGAVLTKRQSKQFLEWAQEVIEENMP